MKKLRSLFGQKEEPVPEADEARRDEITPGADSVTAVHPEVARPEGAAFGLEFVTQDGETKTFTSLPIMIGRDMQNTLILADETVSAKHAQVYFDARLGGVCIEDLNSLNGLFINDQPTRKNMLQDGARIRLGSVSINFRDTGYIHPGEQ